MKLQLDVFWASITGADPVAIIKQYSGRIASLHLKDKEQGAPNVLNEAAVALVSAPPSPPGWRGVTRRSFARRGLPSAEPSPTLEPS